MEFYILYELIAMLQLYIILNFRQDKFHSHSGFAHTITRGMKIPLIRRSGDDICPFPDCAGARCTAEHWHYECCGNPSVQRYREQREDLLGKLTSDSPRKRAVVAHGESGQG